MIITTDEQLSEAIGGTRDDGEDKILSHLESHSIRWIQAATFGGIVMLDHECPRTFLFGGDPGQFRANRTHLWIPLACIDNADTVASLLGDGDAVGSFWVVPGLEDSLRVNGFGRVVGAELVFDVTEMFMHCAKAFKRSNLWSAATSATPRPARIEDAPFCLFGTASVDRRLDLSPRGDPPGEFVRPIGSAELAMPDRPGNKLADCMRNLLARPECSWLFITPGLDEVIVVEGRARLVVDDELLSSMSLQGRAPKISVLMHAEEMQSFTSAAIVRSRLWDPTRFQHRRDWPSLARILADQILGEGTTEAEAAADEYESEIAENYRTSLY
jgi:uncharacterized protein